MPTSGIRRLHSRTRRPISETVIGVAHSGSGSSPVVNDPFASASPDQRRLAASPAICATSWP